MTDRLRQCSMLATALSAATLVSCAATAQVTSTPLQPANGTPAAIDAGQTALRTREALQSYLGVKAGHATPFDALPPLARRRFLDSLSFGSKGLGGFATDDLAMELTDAEVARILSLFDVSQYASAVKTRHPDAPPEWRQRRSGVERVEAAFDELYRLRERESGADSALRQRFDEMFPDLFARRDALSGFSNRDLLYLLRSIELFAADAPTPTDVDQLRTVVTEMHARDIARADDHKAVYDAMLRLHRFGDASQYATAHSDGGLPELPEMVDGLGNAAPDFTVWRANADGQLVRDALDLGPTQILVTAGCHFSEDAADDIIRDPVLGPAFAAHASWLLLPPGQEDQEAVREWNRRFPQAQAMQVYDRREWTMLPPGWSMPTFFIVRDGKVLERIKGWPRKPAINREALIEALERANLL